MKVRMLISLPFHCLILSLAPDDGKLPVSRLGKHGVARHEIDRLDMLDIEVNWESYAKTAAEECYLCGRNAR